MSSISDKVPSFTCPLKHIVWHYALTLVAKLPKCWLQVVMLITLFCVYPDIQSKLISKSKKKRCAALKPWIRSTRNHLWYCTARAGGNVEVCRPLYGLLYSSFRSSTVSLWNCHPIWVAYLSSPFSLARLNCMWCLATFLKMFCYIYSYKKLKSTWN